jgi:glycosyltransferase involved in cell wall biosynthesis
MRYERAMEPRTIVFANSVDYARHTGGWVYNTRVMRELEERGWRVEWRDLPAGFPRPGCDARIVSKQLLAELPDGAPVIADQICWSPLAGIVAPEAARLRFVMIFHHPIAMEEGLPEVERARFAALERKALAACRLVIATSSTTAATLTLDYGVEPRRIVVAPPGIERFARLQALETDEPLLLSVGAVIPRKGYHHLIDALVGLRDLRWRLDIVGDLERAPDYVGTLREMIGNAGLESRVVLRGGIDSSDLEACWQRTHIYVAASLHEGYGMAVAEAIARGVPTVTTRAGAIGDWLDPKAALVVKPGSVEELRGALARVISDAALREQLRQAAQEQAAHFPTWNATARVIDEALAEI